MADKGGWASIGMKGPCPKCGEVGRMIETQIYGKKRWTHFCNICASTWVTIENEDDDRESEK